MGDVDGAGADVAVERAPAGLSEAEIKEHGVLDSKIVACEVSAAEKEAEAAVDGDGEGNEVKGCLGLRRMARWVVRGCKKIGQRSRRGEKEVVVVVVG